VKQKDPEYIIDLCRHIVRDILKIRLRVLRNHDEDTEISVIRNSTEEEGLAMIWIFVYVCT
jgi:hypothetical protein